MLTIKELKKILKPLKLSQIADACKITPHMLWYYMHHENPSYALVYKIVAYLESIGIHIEEVKK